MNKNVKYTDLCLRLPALGINKKRVKEQLKLFL